MVAITKPAATLTHSLRPHRLYIHTPTTTSHLVERPFVNSIYGPPTLLLLPHWMGFFNANPLCTVNVKVG